MLIETGLECGGFFEQTVPRLEAKMASIWYDNTD